MNVSKLWAKAKLIATQISRNTKGYYLLVWFSLEHENGLSEDLPRFLTLEEGNGFEITKQCLKILGHKGKISQLCDQGTFNKSKVLRFGEEFEVTIKVDNESGKRSIDRIREVGKIEIKDPVSESQIDAALGNLEL